ncbi:MAG: hypothetical protein EXS40_10060 [Opitutaceae bacterium]|nr:hypothetical protein [Opitutaceae bacterium]
MDTPCGRFFVGLFLSLVASVVAVCAAEKAAVVVAVQVRGKVEVQHGGADATEIVADGRQLAAADTVTTAKDSSVVLVLENGSTVSLRENSRLKITTALQSPTAGNVPATKTSESQETGTSNTNFELSFGEMLARVRKLNPSSTFEVQTPVSVAAVRGTAFEVSYRADQTGPAQYRLSTASGLVHVTPRGGKLVKVAAGEQAEFSAPVKGKRVRIQPVKHTKISPQKLAQLEKESVDTERSAGALAKRAAAPSAAPNARAAERPQDKAKEVAPEKPKESVSTPRETRKEAAPDNVKAPNSPAEKKKKNSDAPQKK